MRRLAGMLAAVWVLGPVSAAAQDPPPVVAVFNVEVKGVAMGRDVVDGLSDYLAGRVAEGGLYQVVPRDKLKERLVTQKRSSYKECYAQSCQIDLGQELAADKTLAAQVIKLGSRCKANLSLFDLKRAASENAATGSGPCTEDGIVAALEEAVTKLLGRAGGRQTPPQTPPPGVPAAGRAPEVSPVQVTAAPEVEESGPRVKRSTVTAALGDLTIQGKTPAGNPVRLEVTDPSGKATVSGSPFKHPRAAVGQWKVVAKASGHEPVEQSFQVPPDDVTVIKIDLKPFGGLRVAGEPAGSSVKVTGPGGFRDEGGLPWEAEGLRSGRYHVEVSRPGYGQDTRDVDVESGRTANVTVRLAKEEVGGAAVAGTAGIVWVSIPGGSFDMGASDGDANEKPVHRVTLSGFQMSKTEVTVGQYRKCVDAGKCTAPKTGENCNWGKSGRDDHPVNCVDWNQAGTFARWAGGRLATEAEWEYAARSGGRAQTYPWGNEAPSCSRAVMEDGGRGCGRTDSAPVCSKPRGNTAQGLCDMAGNVWEWVSDWKVTYPSGAQTNPTGAASGTERVFRGGSWPDPAKSMRATRRLGFSPTFTNYDVGFRVARPGF